MSALAQSGHEVAHCKCPLLDGKAKRSVSEDGATEIDEFHKRILENLRLAFGVIIMSGDVSGARKLVAEKAQLRTAELTAAERHLERL